MDEDDDDLFYEKTYRFTEDGYESDCSYVTAESDNYLSMEEELWGDLFTQYVTIVGEMNQSISFPLMDLTELFHFKYLTKKSRVINNISLSFHKKSLLKEYLANVR